MPLDGTGTKALKTPPRTVTSAKVRSLLGSLSVKVMVAVSPGRKAVLSLLRAMVGGVLSRVSMLRVTWLLASAPSALKLPLASLNLAEATLMTASALLPALGVKVAV